MDTFFDHCLFHAPKKCEASTAFLKGEGEVVQVNDFHQITGIVPLGLSPYPGSPRIDQTLPHESRGIL